jgi:DNA-binding CsgD family transcriptional regulator
MDKVNRWTKITGGIFIGIAIVFALVYFLSGGTINLALPLVFIMLGLAFYILVFIFLTQWSWAVYLFIPGTILLAFGVIFLLNVTTGDWNSWAYSWLFLITGAAVGVILAARYSHWHRKVTVIAVGTTIFSITLFAVFGVITGGPVIAIMAPVLLLAGGFTLFKMNPEHYLPESFLRRMGTAPQDAGLDPGKEGFTNLPQAESLSPREIEVLRLIERGLSNQEIASRLTLAPSTVKTHINNIYGKLGVESRVQAINRAHELGILTPPNP